MPLRHQSGLEGRSLHAPGWVRGPASKPCAPAYLGDLQDGIHLQKVSLRSSYIKQHVNSKPFTLGMSC